MPWLARALWGTVSVALALLLLWAAIALPDRVPMKLDAAGYPREWGTKPGILAALALAAACCWAMGPLARGISRSMSLDLVNVPFKARWLPAHERALRERMATDLYAVGAATGWMIGFLVLGTAAVAAGAARMPWWALGGAGVGMAWLVIQLVVMVAVRYRRPPSGS